MTVEVRYPVATRTLDNGLRVVVSSTPGLGVVAVNLWYDVGSRHEPPHRHGFAHLFEHLMFQGSRHVGPGEHFALVQGNGGSLNATTSFDRTNYFEVVPSGALDLALWLEADRMAFLDDVLTQQNLETQVAVVAAERSQRMDNVPYGTAFEELLPLVFDTDHPYGHLPIGNVGQLGEATLTEVSEFHARFYLPGNAVLTIVGDAAEADAFARAERHFGRVPSPEAPKRRLPDPLPPVAIEVTREVRADVPSAAVWFGARLPADDAVARELAAVEIAAAILGEGETSRLYRRLVREEEIALTAGVGVNTLIAGNSLGVASVRALPGIGLDSVTEIVAAVLERFADGGPTDLELEIALAQAERGWLDDMSTAGGRADALSGCALLYDDPRALNERIPLLRSLTGEEVREAGARWLLPALNAQLRVLPTESGRAGGDTDDAAHPDADIDADIDSAGAGVER